MSAAEFNEKYPVGTYCVYHPLRPAKGPGRRTSTRSEAWELGHGQAVVLIEGQSGGVSIDHLDIWDTSPDTTE